MTLRNSWPGPSGVTTTTDARIVVGGIVEDAAGVARAGVFPSTLAALVTARTDMNVDIAAFTGVAVQFGGPIFLGNDGTIQLPAVLVSPASGTNFYVIYVKQDESTSPGTDADNLPKSGSVLSTVSFAAARALLPTGALELATVQVPTGVSATNAGGVTITQTFLYTAAEGGVVPVRNSTELAAWTPADGSATYQIDIGIFWGRTAGAWTPITAPSATAAVTSNISNGVTATAAAVPFQSASPTNGVTWSAGTPTRLTVPVAGLYLINAVAVVGSTASGTAFFRVNGSTVSARSFAAANVSGAATVSPLDHLKLNAGDYVELMVQSNGTFTLFPTYMDVTFLARR